MRKYTKYVVILLMLLLVLGIVIVVSNPNSKFSKEDGNFKIVTSFYPIYIMTVNITEGAKNIELFNMADTKVGCIHNYTLTTADMKKIEKADVLIKNGLGLEDFIDKAMTVNTKLQIIDSSENIVDVIKESNETNPHIWTSLSNYILQVKNITKELKKKNPENAERYEENSKKYIQELIGLKQKYDNELDLRGQTAVTLNESFAYLGREIGLELSVIHTSHEESSISAETLKSIIHLMKSTNCKMIIVDRNDDMKNAQTIANETGAKIYELDAGVTGSMDKEAYMNNMKNNLRQLKEK